MLGSRPVMTRISALFFAVLAALVLASCGGGDKGTGSAQDILKEAFGPDKPIKSGRLDVGLKLDLSGTGGLNGPVDIKLRGPFTSNGAQKLPTFDFDATLAGSGTTFTAGAISTPTGGFVKFQGQQFDIGKDLYERFRKGYEQAAKDSGTSGKASNPSLKSLGIDPLRWLGQAKKAGSEQVGGVDTDHVSATVDVPKLLVDIDQLLKKAGQLGVKNAQVPQGLSAAERKQVQDAVKASTFDVWAGKKDGTLRRLRVSVTFDAPASAAKSSGLDKGTIVLDVKLNALNEKQTIKAPANARPLSDLTSQLSSASGSSGAGTTTAPAPTSTTQAPSATTPQGSSKYLDCLQAAGADLGKVQECQALVGQ